MFVPCILHLKHLETNLGSKNCLMLAVLSPLDKKNWDSTMSAECFPPQTSLYFKAIAHAIVTLLEKVLWIHHGLWLPQLIICHEIHPEEGAEQWRFSGVHLFLNFILL